MSVKQTAKRFHDFSCGHRVVGHEGKCALLHGHNYRVHFECVADQLDAVGRVVDFSVIKERLCDWLEDAWDHRLLLWAKDPIVEAMSLPDAKTRHDNRLFATLADSMVVVQFNPTAENMAAHLLEVVGPSMLSGTGARLVKVEIEETRKCSASACLEDAN
jgi:6-pyruvoyltetrahydropterin/6-carboxytetrahydropterin synthase